MATTLKTSAGNEDGMNSLLQRWTNVVDSCDEGEDVFHTDALVLPVFALDHDDVVLPSNCDIDLMHKPGLALPFALVSDEHIFRGEALSTCED